MTAQSPWVRAYTNIALIKYWGKADEQLMIPQNNSLSLTLDAFYSETRVTFDSKYAEDELILDSVKQDASSLKKAQKILDFVRSQAQFNSAARIESKNFVPTAAGLASSASGLAALAGAASLAAGLRLTRYELSALARLGSGSACRSIFGGFSEWEKGHDHESSHAYPIDAHSDQLAMLFIIVKSQPKEVSSTQGMQHAVSTSPYYPGWLTSTKDDLIKIKSAIQNDDIKQIGQIAESSALKMHALNFSSFPPFNYWTPESIEAMNHVKILRNNGFTTYFTMDAGPNIKIICPKDEVQAVSQYFEREMPSTKRVCAFAGPGLQWQNAQGEWVPYHE